MIRAYPALRWHLPGFLADRQAILPYNEPDSPTRAYKWACTMFVDPRPTPRELSVLERRTYLRSGAESTRKRLLPTTPGREKSALRVRRSVRDRRHPFTEELRLDVQYEPDNLFDTGRLFYETEETWRACGYIASAVERAAALPAPAAIFRRPDGREFQQIDPQRIPDNRIRRNPHINFLTQGPRSPRSPDLRPGPLLLWCFNLLLFFLAVASAIGVGPLSSSSIDCPVRRDYTSRLHSGDSAPARRLQDRGEGRPVDDSPRTT